MTGEYVWDPGEANPKQKLFFASRSLYTAYGGAKGGGKTWAVRTKALLGAYNYAGIRILILRRTYPELQSNHIEPMLKMINPEFCSYNGSLRSIYFANGSLIHFGHWAGETSELEYNGQEYDWIFLDEATQFTWRSFQFLGGLLRGVNDFPKRMYITCNPGGVGHRWVKRLFIDRDFITDPDDPEASENPDDYVFIPATVEDNTALLRSSPAYLRMLASMPENLRRAYRYGEWDSLGGNYFPEFSEAAHVAEPFALPASWKRYRAFDYGLDMFACAWFAVDGEGRSWMYREFSAPGLIVREAAEAMLSHRHVEPAEGHGPHHGRDLHGKRSAHREGRQQPRAGPSAHKGGPGPPGRRTAHAGLFQKLQADHRGPARHPGGRGKPQRLRPRTPRRHPPRGRRALFLHQPNPRRRGRRAGPLARGRGRAAGGI